jgi:hypothetical protein
MLLIVAFALFVTLLAAWIAAPVASPERRPAAESSAAIPELRSHPA